MDTQDSPWPGLGGNHHLPTYSILCNSPRGPHPNGFLAGDSQVGVPKSPRLRLMWLWGAITLRANIGWSWGLKQSCSPCRELSNDMFHTIWRQVNRVNSWLFLVRSQIGNLTPDPSFGHNLCFRCPNEQCEPILNIYVPRVLQWYKERHKPLSFDPWNCSLKFLEFIGTPSPKVGVALGVWGFTFLHSQEYVMWLSGFLLACTLATPFALVASPKLGLRQRFQCCLCLILWITLLSQNLVKKHGEQASGIQYGICKKKSWLVNMKI